ncbi:MAG: hypothetical protein MUO43_05665, partial [Desulfobacterales bacterium]|nr:hypothetical protein [Desulfobacterales bacterium]
MKTRNLSIVILVILFLLAGISTANEQNRNKEKHCNGQYPCGDPSIPDVPDPQDPTDPTDPVTPSDPINPGDDNQNINNLARQFSGGNHVIFMLGVRAGAEQWRIDHGCGTGSLVDFGQYQYHPT